MYQHGKLANSPSIYLFVKKMKERKKEKKTTPKHKQCDLEQLDVFMLKGTRDSWERWGVLVNAAEETM